MVTEAQRLQMLTILCGALVDRDELVRRMSLELGREVTSKEIDDAINKLRSVRGT